MLQPGGPMGTPPGAGPSINMLPTPPCTLKVLNIPSFVTQADFSRLMLQLEGCQDARLLGRQPGGDQVGYAEFSDKMNGSKAKNLYHGWTGWGGRGLAIEMTDFALSQLTQLPVGQKRLREGEDMLQPDGNFKQARGDMPVMGMGGQPSMQQQVPQQQAMGLLQNLLQQQPGIAQQLLASAQQGSGMLQPQQQGGMVQGQGGVGSGGGGYNGYVPAPVQQPQPQQQFLPQAQQQQPVQQQYGMQQQQPVATGYAPQPVQQQAVAPNYAPQPVQQQQPMMMQQPAQQQYGMAPQAQQPVMLQGGMPQQQQPMMQQQPVQQQPQMMQQAQGLTVQGGRRGDVVAPVGMRQYPPDACNTLYVEGLPADITRRELAHIFRAHEGYRSLRLVIKDSKKHVGEKLVMAFAEFTSTYFATEAMDRLQGYPFDLDDPDTRTLFIKYARPMDHPPRRGPGMPMMGRGRGGAGAGGGRGPGADMRSGPPPAGGRGGMGGGRGGGRYGGGGPLREGPR